MLGWTPNKRWLITKSDKLPQNAPAQSGHSESQTGYPRVHIVRQAIPGFSEKTPWIERGLQSPRQRGRERKTGEDRGRQREEGDKEEEEKDIGNMRS